MRRAVVPFALFGLVACGGPLRPSEHPEALVDPRYEDARGNVLSLDEVTARLVHARVIYIGERHDRVSDHAMQSALQAELGPRAVGLEMFGQPMQAALDAYVAREIDEATMLTRTEWETRWGYDFSMYRPILDRARQNGSALLALNAPRELARAISRGGLGSLSEAQRAELPELDLEVADHRARFVAAMGEHPRMTPERVDRYYEAQVVWDETMADRVARHVADHDAADLIVLAGEMHVQRDAVPARAARRGAAPYAIVLPIDEDDLAEARPDADILAIFP